MYRRLGFEPGGERTIEDADRSREYGFRKALAAGRHPADGVREPG